MKLRLTPQAGEELREAVTYVKDRSPSGAARVFDAIERTFELLRENPEIGRPQR